MLRKRKQSQSEADFTRIYLWRHPEARGQNEGTFWGHSDPDLSREGKKQAHAVVLYMNQIQLHAVFSSDLIRTRKLAEQIARGQKRRVVVEAMKELRELNLGAWEGLTYDHIVRQYPNELEQHQKDLPGFKVKNGESLNEMAERVIPAFETIIQTYPNRRICVVGHGGVNRVLLSRILGAPLDYIFRIAQDHVCLNIIDVYPDGTPVIKAVNQNILPQTMSEHVAR